MSHVELPQSRVGNVQINSISTSRWCRNAFQTIVTRARFISPYDGIFWGKGVTAVMFAFHSLAIGASFGEPAVDANCDGGTGDMLFCP